MKVYFWPCRAICEACGYVLAYEQHKRGDNHVDARCMSSGCERNGLLLRIQLFEKEAYVLPGYETLNRERTQLWDKVNRQHQRAQLAILTQALAFYSQSPDGQYDDVVVPLLEREIARLGS